jgi:hypothetical protein
MDIALLSRLFGTDQRWQGPCTLILEAEASITTVGADAIVGSGTKAYAPRISSGRVAADFVCLLQDGSAVVALQQTRTRLQSGEELVKQTVTLIDPSTIVAVEWQDTTPLTSLGIAAPAPAARPSGSHPGIAPRPRV